MTKERHSNKTNKQTKCKKQQIYVVNYNQMGHYLRVKNNIAKFKKNDFIANKYAT